MKLESAFLLMTKLGTYRRPVTNYFVMYITFCPWSLIFYQINITKENDICGHLLLCIDLNCQIYCIDAPIQCISRVRDVYFTKRQSLQPMWPWPLTFVFLCPIFLDSVVLWGQKIKFTFHEMSVTMMFYLQPKYCHLSGQMIVFWTVLRAYLTESILWISSNY